MTMMKLIEKMEDKVIARYGFEHPMTIKVFKVTELLRRLA